MNNVTRHNGWSSQTKDCKTASLWCMFMACSLHFFYILHNTPQKYSLAFVLLPLFTLHPITSLPSSNIPLKVLSPSSLFMSPGTHAQQAFRTEPRNLTVRMGATAVLRCEVLRASGTVQWVKDGLLLGPQRRLPGFERYSMIGNLKRGKQGDSQNKLDLMDPSKLNK